MDALSSFRLKFLDVNMIFVQKYTNIFLWKNVAFKIKKVPHHIVNNYDFRD